MADTDEYHELTAAELAERWREKSALEYAELTAKQPVGEEYQTPAAALEWLRGLAWGDLQQARGRALNGVWSMECDNVIDQIVGITSLVGPEPWESVNVSLILDGLYERIHEAAGYPTPLSDADRARAQAVMDRRHR